MTGVTSPRLLATCVCVFSLAAACGSTQRPVIVVRHPSAGFTAPAGSEAVRSRQCVPDNRPRRVLAEVGGFYLGALPALLPILISELTGELRQWGVLITVPPSVLAATFTGALGAWGFGRLLGGDGGYGWTWLGVLVSSATVFGPIYTGGLFSAGGASLGFELSTSRTCDRGERPSTRAAWAAWTVAPAVGRVGAGSYYGLALTVTN